MVSSWKPPVVEVEALELERVEEELREVVRELDSQMESGHVIASRDIIGPANQIKALADRINDLRR